VRELVEPGSVLDTSSERSDWQLHRGGFVNVKTGEFWHEVGPVASVGPPSGAQHVARVDPGT
jgi:hypothetical protein